MPMNMAHCRFDNTLAALRECEEVLDDDRVFRLSEAELEAARKLVDLCAHIGREHAFL